MDWPANPQQIEALVAEYYSPLYRYGYRLSGRAGDADDLTQETFCVAQVQLRHLRDPGRVKQWLYSILRNCYLQRVRHDQRQKLVSVEGLDEIAEAAPEALPEVSSEELQTALNELPELFRTPVILYYFEEFSYREIAEQMELPIGTVMSRLARAKAHLRQRLLAPQPIPTLPNGGDHDLP